MDAGKGALFFPPVSGFQPDPHSERTLFYWLKMRIDFKEVDIEDFIWRSIPTGTLEKRGLHLPRGIYYRQMNLVGAGIMDIVGIQIGKDIHDGVSYPFLRVRIYELKQHQITCNDVGQLCRYIDSVEVNSEKIKAHFNVPENYTIQVSGALIGHGIERDAFHLLMMLRGSVVDVMRYHISFDVGMSFGLVDENSYIPEVEFHALPQIKTSDLLRGSRPLITDLTPKQKIFDSGEASTDNSQQSLEIPF